VRPAGRRRRGPRLLRLGGLSFFDFGPMMPDGAPDRRPRDGMMPRDMARHGADGRAFQATLRTAHRRQQGDRRGNDNAQQ